MAEQGGLLDFLNSPGGMGLLSAVGAGLAGARRGGTWNAVGSGLLGGVQGYAQGQDLQRQNEYATQRGKLFDMQVQQMQEQQAAARAEAEKAASRQNYLGSLGQVTSPRLDAQPNKFDPMQFVRLGGSIEDAQKLAGMGDWGRAEVARTLESQDAQGNKITLQFDKFGRPVGEGVQGYTAPVQVDLGGRVQFVKPQAGVNLTKTMTPEGSDASRRGWASIELQKQQTNQPKPEYRDGQWVMAPKDMKPGESRVVVQPTNKPLTDSQAKAYLFGSRMSEADDILGQLAKGGTDRKGNIKSVLESTPLVGDSLGTLTNWTQSDNQQKVEQAQRDFINAVLRRESGAVISPSEFDNAAKQYFPQLGDSDAVKAQKAKNRKLAVQATLAEVPGNRSAQPTKPAADPTVSNW